MVGSFISESTVDMSCVFKYKELQTTNGKTARPQQLQTTSHGQGDDQTKELSFVIGTKLQRSLSSWIASAISLK